MRHGLDSAAACGAGNFQSREARDLGFFPACECGDNLAAEVDALKQVDYSERLVTENLADIMRRRDAIPASAYVPGTVLDPFGGSGTVAQAARKLNRRSVLIELNPEYEAVMRERLGLENGGGLFGDDDLGVEFVSVESEEGKR